MLFSDERVLTDQDLNDLTQIPQDERELDRARLRFERALEEYQKSFGPDHPNTHRVRSSLARLLVAAGDPTAALVFAETAFDAYANAFGSCHPWTKDSARVTAEALEALGRTEEAGALRERYGLTGD
jgi:hypothetical protein